MGSESADSPLLSPVFFACKKQRKPLLREGQREDIMDSHIRSGQMWPIPGPFFSGQMTEIHSVFSFLTFLTLQYLKRKKSSSGLDYAYVPREFIDGYSLSITRRPFLEAVLIKKM